MKRSGFTISRLLLTVPLVFAGCAGFLGVNQTDRVKPIANPFMDYHPGGKYDTSQNMILRTKKGDRTVELEIPGETERLSEFVLPVSPAFKDTSRAPASIPGSDGAAIDESYANHAASASDREITSGFPQALPELDNKRRAIEEGLNLAASEDDFSSDKSPSYLANMDMIKQLYKAARYEAALLKTDEMIRLYQTDSKLYEMRGTLLDRMGRRELALKSWNQALQFDPKNSSLRQFIERKQPGRGVGSP